MAIGPIQAVSAGIASVEEGIAPRRDGAEGLFASLLAEQLKNTAGDDAASAVEGSKTVADATDVPSTTAPTPAPAHHDYEVSYVHGATPVSVGPTPAPLVKNASGQLVLTAKTTGLTQIGPFTGTVSDPTAAAKATPSVMAQIAQLIEDGQA